MSPLKLLSQDKIGDFLNLLPISRENLRKTDLCLAQKYRECPGAYSTKQYTYF